MVAALITTDLDPVPSRSAPSTFSTYTDAFLGKLPAWTAEANALATQANNDAETSTIAAALVPSALAATNYAGVWTTLASLVGAASAGISVYHDNEYWRLLVDLANIATSEPGDANTDWSKIRTYPIEKVQNLGTLTVDTEIDLRNGLAAIFTVGADITITIVGWPESGIIAEPLFVIINGDAYPLTLPTTNWILPNGGLTTVFDDNETPLQASGIDFVYLISFDGGTTKYGKVTR